MTGLVYIDLTTLASVRGQPVGISRCQQKYADYAYRNLPNVHFTLFDPTKRCYRNLEPKLAEAIIQETLKLDTTMAPDINAHRKHFVDRLPVQLRPLYWWLSKPRRRMIALLERIRVSKQNTRSSDLAAKIQNLLIKRKERPRYFDADGRRIDIFDFSTLVGEPVNFLPEDTTLAIQSDWVHTDIASIAALKAKTGWRHVILCHDIIPIQFPQWYQQPDVDGFKTYYNGAFRIADRVMFTSSCTESDARNYCQALGFDIDDRAVVPMGADISTNRRVAGHLPAGLEPSRFALFVSTIEPRKNHRLLIAAWRVMVKSGVIKRSGFKLVFVGRPGWQMGSFYNDIASDPLLKDSVIHLQNVDDEALAHLYEQAAFCLYPPKFEGFGLPIIEALAYGKALLVSNAGPMQEIAGGYAIALDPENAADWEREMTNWIEHPDEREKWAIKARRGYEPLTWDASAKQFFEKALAPFAED